MNDRYWLAGGSKPVPHVTNAAFRFADEHSRLLEFHVFFSNAKLRTLRETGAKSAEALAILNNEFAQHDALLAEVVLCRVVDNFLSFVSDLLALIYKARPEMLKSSEQERTDFILQFESMDELIVAIAEKKVERLAYLGLKDLSEHLEKQMGFMLMPSKDDLERAALIVEYRNLFVHNRGVISTLSGKRFEVLKPKVGSRLAVNPDEIRPIRQFIENAVLDADVRATEKFGLPASKLPEPPVDLME